MQLRHHTYPDSRIGDDARALEITKRDSFARLPKRIPADQSKEYNAPKAGQEQPILGPQVFRMNIWQLMQWNLATHAGFVTYHHKDANGLCTWIYAHTGVKIWAVLEPKYTDEHKSRSEMDSLHKKICYSNGIEVSKFANFTTVFLSAGELLQVIFILYSIFVLT
jgi:hypothetical protein